jgi:hypothetical protein
VRRLAWEHRWTSRTKAKVTERGTGGGVVLTGAKVVRVIAHRTCMASPLCARLVSAWAVGR